MPHESKNEFENCTQLGLVWGVYKADDRLGSQLGCFFTRDVGVVQLLIKVKIKWSVWQQ